MELLLRADQVAERLNICRSRVYEMMSAGELPTVRFGRSVRVPVDALHKWIADQQAGTTEGA